MFVLFHVLTRIRMITGITFQTSIHKLIVTGNTPLQEVPGNVTDRITSIRMVGPP